MKIISGGQTGADQAGLEAAKQLGFETGGFMPDGFMTEAGPRPEFAQMYGVIELIGAGYKTRTWMNVRQADATIWFGGQLSPGHQVTALAAINLQKSWFEVFDSIWKLNHATLMLEEWLKRETKEGRPIRVLNVAGHRESKSPGIGEFTKKVLLGCTFPLI